MQFGCHCSWADFPAWPSDRTPSLPEEECGGCVAESGKPTCFRELKLKAALAGGPSSGGMGAGRAHAYK